jgi:small subunit ribosomal protein S7
MARRISTQKRFPKINFQYNSLLVSLLINRILLKGKKRLAYKIVKKAFDVIQLRTNQKPIIIFEKAVRNCSPRVQLKPKRLGGATYQVPSLLTKFRATNLAIRWLVNFSRKRSGKGIALKLANEFIDAAKGVGNTIKKKDETHKMAEANKAFAKLK